MQENGALKGVKVTDFSWAIAGPLITTRLAMFGATVVKVETHRRPDAVRLYLPFKDGQPNVDKCPWAAIANSSKYSLSIDLNTPKGREIAWKLISWCDIVVENFTPGTMAKWGLDYANVSKVKPDIIYLSASQMGQTGPYRNYSSYGYQSSAIMGFTEITGWPEREPCSFHAAYTDFIGPRFGAVAVLAALEYKRRTGKGQFLDQAQLQSAIHFLAPNIMDFAVNGRILERSGNRHDYAAPHGVYPCNGADSWCAIAVFNQKHWVALCNVIKQEWTNDPAFSTVMGRKQNEDKLDRLLSQWTINYDAKELESLLVEEGIPASAVETVADLFDDTQLKYRGFFRQFKHSMMGYHSYRGPAFKLSRCPDNQFAGPGLGEHNKLVCKEFLKMSDEEIAEAIIDGGITTEADLPSISSAL